MKAWIGAACVAATLSLGAPPAMSATKVAPSVKAQAASDATRARLFRRYPAYPTYARYPSYPAYYARPYYYRPYPYTVPVPFFLGFGYLPYY